MENIRKIKIAIFLFLMVIIPSFKSIAQQEALFTQYMFNTLQLNPAYAGSHNGLESAMIYRTQWVGYDGAPNTLNFALHSPLENNKHALGLNFNFDVIGVTSTIRISSIYAYRIIFGNGNVLSFGIQPSVLNYSARLTELDPANPGDAAFSQNMNKWFFNVGAGAYFYSDKFYVGFSIPYTLANNVESANTISGNAINQTKLMRHYYLIGGYVFDIGEKWALKPNTAFRYIEGLYLTVDLNLNLYYNELIGLGVSYRSKEALCFLMELFINDKFKIGYSYDLVLTGLNVMNKGSHEIMLSFRYPFVKNPSVSPRYF